MRRSVSILFLCLAATGAGADNKPEPLPALNARVYEFAKASLGKPVGDGICITLAVKALEASGGKRSSFREVNGDYVWGEPVTDLKDALPGDILQLRNAVFHGQRPIGRGRIVSWHQEYPHHTAIVAKVERAGKVITVYHQNVTTKGNDESEKGKVQEGELRMESLQKGGWIKAYRPVPADEVPSRKGIVEADDPGQ